MTPTEAEIREALAHEMVERVSDHSGDVVYDASEPLRKLWNCDEFRASETAVWEALVEVVYQQADHRFAEFLLDELTRVGVEFARQYPDAPRATRETVPA
jgi:hypothetical protein